ncbi:MAG TPA: Gmad2 immunoglobulin-like domain-containing protein [Thermomicrobiales bacterium]|nr:Gmad2 immunoglobulin-like domain-containing protein [Thermomicrobiales bacterium]
MWRAWRRVAICVGVVAALLAAPLGTALAAPAASAPAAVAAAAAGGACRPNPSPPSGMPTIQVVLPEPGQVVASPLTVTGLAVAFEAQFAITLYGQNGQQLAQIPAHTAEGQTLSPFSVSVPYTITTEQDGCLWLYNVSGKDGSAINIVQVPVHLLAGNAPLCFSQVGGVCIDGKFRAYWINNGGLYQFGYPLAPGRMEQEIDGKTYFVQYFERARFESHPENQPPYDVLLGLLGDEVTANRHGEQPFKPLPRPADCAQVASACVSHDGAWFAATGHTLGIGGAGPAAISKQWVSKGGLLIYGYPISEVFTEKGYDGKTYQVQYFERHRLEYHPDLAGTIYVVELGQLGRQVYTAKYGGH